jgi:hypothetical protein
MLSVILVYVDDIARNFIFKAKLHCLEKSSTRVDTCEDGYGRANDATGERFAEHGRRRSRGRFEVCVRENSVNYVDHPVGCRDIRRDDTGSRVTGSDVSASGVDQELERFTCSGGVVEGVAQWG